MSLSRLCSYVSAATLLLVLTAASQPAGSGATEPADRFHFKVCNTKTFTIIVAVRFNSDGKNYVTHGWWQIEPLTCQEVADFRRGHFYMFAQSFNTNPIQVFVLGSDLARFCVTLSGSFSYSGTNTCDVADYRDFSHLVVSNPTLRWTL
jgi:uncharacterized membrane protein